MQSKIVAMIAAVVVVGAGAWYAFQLDKPEPVEIVQPEIQPKPIIRDEPPPPAEESVEPESTSPPDQSAADEFVPKAKPEPIIEPPSRVPGSDNVVYQAVEDLGANLAPWFTPSDQVDKWVLTVDLLASGNIPNKHLPVAINMGQFKVVKEGETYHADTANYHRADALIDAVTAIPPQRLVQYYQAWRPLLEQSYRGLGKPDSFDQRLKQAIDQILNTKSLSGSPDLQRPGVMYKYADPALEKAPAVSRWLWRLGPGNTRRIQLYLMELKPLL